MNPQNTYPSAEMPPMTTPQPVPEVEAQSTTTEVAAPTQPVTQITNSEIAPENEDPINLVANQEASEQPVTANPSDNKTYIFTHQDVNTNKKNLWWVWLIVGLVTLAVIAGVVYFIFISANKTSEVPETVTTEESVSVETEADASTTETASTDSNNTGSTTGTDDATTGATSATPAPAATDSTTASSTSAPAVSAPVTAVPQTTISPTPASTPSIAATATTETTTSSLSEAGSPLQSLVLNLGFSVTIFAFLNLLFRKPVLKYLKRK